MTLIGNPQGAYGYDPVDGSNTYSCQTLFQASEAITAGDVVSFAAVTDVSSPLTINRSDNDDSPNIIAGVAVNDIAAGETGLVVVHGVAVVKAAAGIVAGNAAYATANEGEADDAVLGNSFGTFLSATGVPAASQAIVWVDN